MLAAKIRPIEMAMRTFHGMEYKDVLIPYELCDEDEAED
jgi:hypothetical protein